MGAEQSNITRRNIETDVDLRSFNLLRVVGKGAFGKVRIVQKKDTGVLYALKYINKLQCIRMRAIQNIFRERCILEDINHPLIVNLRYAWQDDFHMFMVLDLMEGGDLRFHLDKYHGFPEPVIRGWAAELVFAIDYLHSKNVLHRDLKPDNVLLDGKGHAHLTDFNIAVNFSDKRMLKSHSGTLAYMAPDILADKGYMQQIDWWSLGAILYELYYGKRPFRGATNSELAKAIKAGNVVFHDCNQVTKKPLRISHSFQSFLQGLMTVDRDKRLGCGPMGGREVMNHPFFQGVDWERVGRKETTPLFVPDISKPNFDANVEAEENKADEEYLQYRPKQRQNKTQMNEQIAAAQFDAATISRSGAVPGPNNMPSVNAIGGGAGNGASLANFLGASALDPAVGGGNNAKILEVTQLLGLAQIKDVKDADPKAANTERIEAELDFIDANYDPYDWEVVAREAMWKDDGVELDLEGFGGGGGRSSDDPYSGGNNGGGFGMGSLGRLPRVGSFGRLPRIGSLGKGNDSGVLPRVGSLGKGEQTRGRQMDPSGSGGSPGSGAGEFMNKLRNKSIGALNRAREMKDDFVSIERKKSVGRNGQPQYESSSPLVPPRRYK
ncbi:kinase-like domain-containing protein [Obelidium mucronatum]|nr:kinase-like domain-containing protein [Obelidium mucronatum]